MKFLYLIYGILLIQFTDALETQVNIEKSVIEDYVGEFMIKKCKYTNKQEDLEFVKGIIDKNKDILKADNLIVEKFYFNSQEKFPHINKTVIDNYPIVMSVRNTFTMDKTFEFEAFIVKWLTVCNEKMEYFIPPYSIGANAYLEVVGGLYGYKKGQKFTNETYDMFTNRVKHVMKEQNITLPVLDYYNPDSDLMTVFIQPTLIHSSKEPGYGLKALDKILNSDITESRAPKNMFVRESDLKRFKSKYPFTNNNNNGTILKMNLFILLIGGLVWFVSFW